MQPKDYFKKTFVFVFIFFTVYKLVGMIMNNAYSLEGIGKTTLIGFVIALIAAGVNYYLKWDFFKTKAERKRTDL
jgi:hypothetical protein